MRQLVHSHSRGDRYRRHLCDVHRSLAETWHPNIFAVLRSAISLRKPNLRPSMIVRVVESKWTTAVTMSCIARAFLR